MKELTQQEKRQGQRNYLAFCTLNGLSMALLAETTLILYALKLGVPDYIVSVLASFGFLGTFFVIAGGQLVRKIGAPKAASWSWYLRNFFGAITALAPIFMAYYSPIMGIIVIFIGALGFYAFRGVGKAALLPMIGEITTTEEKGRFNTKTAFSFNAGYFIAMLALIMLFHLSDNVDTFQFIIIVGFLIGCYSAYRVSRVPESGSSRESAAYSFIASYRYTLRDYVLKRVLIMQIIGYICMALVVPFTILAVKEVYEMKDYRALFFVLIQGLGGILAAIAASRYAGKITRKRQMLISYIMLMMAALMWFLMPVKFSALFAFAMFLIIGVGQIGLFTALDQYILIVSPAERLVGTNIVMSVTSCTIAGLVGAFAGAVVLEVLETLNLSEISIYRTFFGIMFIAILAGYIILLKMERDVSSKFNKSE